MSGLDVGAALGSVRGDRRPWRGRALLTAGLVPRCLEHFDPLSLLRLLPHDRSSVVGGAGHQRAELGMRPLHLPDGSVVGGDASKKSLLLQRHVEDANGAVGGGGGQPLAVVVQLGVVLRRETGHRQRCAVSETVAVPERCAVQMHGCAAFGGLTIISSWPVSNVTVVADMMWTEQERVWAGGEQPGYGFTLHWKEGGSCVT